MPGEAPGLSEVGALKLAAPWCGESAVGLVAPEFPGLVAPEFPGLVAPEFPGLAGVTFDGPEVVP